MLSPTTRALRWVAPLLALLIPAHASAATVLFVSDFSSDTGIVAALRADGHDVTVVVNDFVAGTNVELALPLDAFDAVYWSATAGPHDDPAVLANLTVYVQRGGRLLVTGDDALVNPEERELIGLLGGLTARNVSTTAGAVTALETSLTVGVVDIRGVTPGGSFDNDCIEALGSDTLVVAGNADETSCGQWTLRRLGDGEAAFVSNSSSVVWTDETPGGLGAYNAAIRNFAAASGTTVTEPGAPTLRFLNTEASPEGQPIEVRVEVEDLEGDAFTLEWDLDDDGVFDAENAGRFDYTVAASRADGPSGVRLGVRATDEGGRRSVRYQTLRVVNLPPEVRSRPPRLASVDVELDYPIDVADPAGPLDPLRFALTAGPPGMNVSDAGRVTWVPDVSDVTLPGASVAVAVEIDDGDGARVEHRFELVVVANRPPAAPTLVSPIDEVAIDLATPRLVIENAQDPDLDPLVYAFELDASADFDSPSLRRSPTVEEREGFTEWRLEAALEPGRRYYWRARADDGVAFSEWSGASFFVVREAAPRDAGASDGGPPAGLGGGACAASGAPPGGSRPWPLALVLLAFLRRRRSIEATAVATC